MTHATAHPHRHPLLPARPPPSTPLATLLHSPPSSILLTPSILIGGPVVRPRLGEGFYIPSVLGGTPYGRDQRCCWVHGSAWLPATAVN